jgi:PAS domain S-box-containing protein
MKNMKGPSTAYRYLAALIAPAIVALVMQLTWPFFKDSPAAIYLLTIAFSSWYGGLRPGLVSAIVSLLLVNYFFIAPYFSLGHSSPTDFVRLIILAAVGVLISVLIELLQREKARAEENLRVLQASEERYRKLADNFPNGAVSTYDKDLRMTFIAGKGLEKNSLSADFFIGKSLKEIAPPEAVAIVEPHFRAAFAGETVSYECAYPDGRIYFASVAPLFDGTNINEILVIAQNVTEHRVIENKLMQSESQLAEAQRLANIGSWNWDLKSNERTWSENLFRIFGLPSDRPVPDLDTTVAECIHPDDRQFFRSSIESSIRNRESWSLSYRIVRPDGEERIISSRGNVVTDSSGNIRMFGTAQDITEHEDAEKARREAEEKYRDIFENAGEGIFQSTPEGQYIAANPALARIHGFDSPEELINSRRDITREVYVDSARRVEFKRQLEERGFVRGFEHEIFRQDGSRIWCSVNARAVRDENGIVQYYEGTAQDITERKRTEAALRESEELFSKAFHSSPAPLIMTRLSDGCFLNVNDAFLRTFEYKRAEVIGQTVSTLGIYVDPGDRENLISELLERGSLRQYESRARTKSGRILDLLDFVEPVNLKGEPCLLATAYDVTDRKRVEEALRESEERYRELFENAKDALYVHDLSGRYVSLNRAAEKLIGFNRDEIIGKHFSNFVVPRDLKHVRKNFCKKLDEESETSYEIDLLTKDRRRVPVEVVSRLIYENGEPVGVQGTARDITERKRAQEALQMYSRRLIEAQEAERQSLARELHDEIGQVLTAVRISLQAAQSTQREDASLPELEESIVIVDEALGRIHDLCLELRPSLLDDLGLAAALRWYVDRYRQRTGIAAEVLNGFEGRGRLPQQLETQCFRIAQEALTNVARHAQASRVSIQVKCAADKLVLTIIDNGIGFDTENLLKTASSASTLGLRGMKERALAMNGRIVIESTPGSGTQIQASFPLR